MIICGYFAGRKVLILGLGMTGQGAVESLIASKAQVFAWDDNIESVNNCKLLYPQANYINPKEINWKELEFVILSPGIPTLPGKEHEVVRLAYRHNIKIISDMDVLYLANQEAKYIAITGTNGKSTTTAMIGHIIKNAGIEVQVGGNIGVSVLNLEPMGSDGVYVLEVSSFQLDLVTFAAFDISVLLNITPDHLDRHGSMRNYIAAKRKIFGVGKANNQAIISIDSPVLQDVAKDLPNKIEISTREQSKVCMLGRVLYDNINKKKFDFTSYDKLPGKHNEENIASAYAACLTFGLKPEEIVKHIKTFKGLSHRIETVLESNGLKFINDSKATNAEAAEKAISCFDNIIWIAGGVSKEGGIESLKPLFKKIQFTYLIGQAQDEFAKTLDAAGVKYLKSQTLNNVLEDIKKSKIKKGTILLSPACASYDQYKSYEHRGDEFKKLVFEKFFSFVNDKKAS